MIHSKELIYRQCPVMVKPSVHWQHKNAERQRLLLIFGQKQTESTYNHQNQKSGHRSLIPTISSNVLWMTSQSRSQRWMYGICIPGLQMHREALNLITASMFWKIQKQRLLRQTHFLLHQWLSR